MNTEAQKNKQAKNLLTDDQKAIISTMGLFPDQSLQYLLCPLEVTSVDDAVVELVIKEGAFLIDILNYFHNKHNICPDLTENIVMFRMLVSSIHFIINSALENCKQGMGLDDAMDVFDQVEILPDEQFALYAIDVQEKFRECSDLVGDEFDSEYFVLNPMSKNTDMFEYDFWISVFVDNVIRIGSPIALREEKYW